MVVVVVQSLSCVRLFATLWMQHARLPFPSPPPRACSDSCPLSEWCHQTISSVVPFSYCLQSFPALGSFPMSQFFTSGASVASASASVLPTNVQDWFPLGWTGLISCSPRNSQESSPTSQFKIINSLAFSLLYGPTLTSIYGDWKKHSFDYTVLCQWSICPGLLICCLGLSKLFFQGASIF